MPKVKLTSEKAIEMAKMKIGSHHTQETKDKISKKMSNRILTQETKNKLASTKIEYTYYLKDPTGLRFVTTNMHDFARNFGLIRSAMNKVCRGVQHNHKGWTCVEKVKIVK